MKAIAVCALGASLLPYRYAYINDLPVLVDPHDRRVVSVHR